MFRTEPIAISVSEAKRHLSELLERVASERRSCVILRRGRPMARLVPIRASEERPRLRDLRGWLDDDDPFFETIDRIVRERSVRPPRGAQSPRLGE